MALQTFSCTDPNCGAQFAMSDDDLDANEVLVCPVCGEELDEEEESAPAPARSNPRRRNPRRGR